MAELSLQDGYHDLKDLVGKMWTLDPSQRPSYADILGHNWFKDEMATADEIKYLFTEDFKKLIIDDKELYLKTEKSEGERLSKGNAG